ncbi:MAG TPA: hypothetical protein PLK08_08995, partial [Phycisphaerae bacterium]|nr:hypothetical protein [Phycisphaerae bacterium]
RLMSMADTQAEVKRSLADLSHHIAGNGKPGLTERVRKLEWWHGLKVKAAVWLLGIAATIGTGYIVYKITRTEYHESETSKKEICTNQNASL